MKRRKRLIKSLKNYSDYIDIIDGVENIEQVIITDNKIKKMLLLFTRINEVCDTIFQKNCKY